MLQLRRYLKGLLPDHAIECKRYRDAHGRWPNIANPRRFTEKVLRRKLRDRNPLYSSCSDKLGVRDYVSARIGDAYLVPVAAALSDPAELLKLQSWAGTVVKPNHGSMMVEIIGDEEPSRERKEDLIALFGQWLEVDYSTRYGEKHYKNIEPRLVVEVNVAPNGEELVEWKFHCFRQPDGSVKVMLQLIGERFQAKSMSFYLLDVTPSGPVRTIGENPPCMVEADRTLLMEARRLSEELSRDFGYVRVDWMVSDGQLYFSELTFTPGAGFSTSFGPALDRQLAEWWVLP